jgi:hypothetical protein
LFVRWPNDAFVIPARARSQKAENDANVTRAGNNARRDAVSSAPVNEPRRTTMRLIMVLACFAASVAAASPADAKEGPWPLGSAWPAPSGHFQPRPADIPIGIPLSPSTEEQEALDRAVDEKLQICRGC